MIDVLSNKDKLTIIETLKKHTKDVFITSSEHVKPLSRSVSFAYGWLMIAYGSEYAVTKEKLSDLIIENVQYISNQLLAIAKILAVDEESFRNMGIYHIVIEKDIHTVKEFLYNVYNIFTITVSNLKASLDELTEDSEDISVLDSFLRFEFFDILYK